MASGSELQPTTTIDNITQTSPTISIGESQGEGGGDSLVFIRDGKFQAQGATFRRPRTRSDPGHNRQGAQACRTEQQANRLSTAFSPPESAVHPSVVNIRPDLKSGPQMSGMQQADPKPSRSSKIKRLRKKHAEVARLYESVWAKKDELEPQYTDLNIWIEELRDSQENFMNFMREELGRIDGNRDISDLVQRWERVKEDAETFNNILSRIRQHEELLVEPQAELIVAEEEFVAMAKEIVAPGPKLSSSEKSQPGQSLSQQPPTTYGSAIEPIPRLAVEPLAITEQPVTPSNASEVDSMPNDQASPVLSALSELRNRRNDLKFCRERLNELEWEQEEDTFARELLLDRGDQPSIPEDEFQSSYLTARRKLENNIEETLVEIARLEEVCRLQNLTQSPPRTPKRSSSMEYIDHSPGADNAELAPPGPASGPSSWYTTDKQLLMNSSLESLAGSTTDGGRNPYRIREWLANPDLVKDASNENQPPIESVRATSEDGNIP